jgi:hypothetical protein
MIREASLHFMVQLQIVDNEHIPFFWRQRL